MIYNVLKFKNRQNKRINKSSYSQCDIFAAQNRQNDNKSSNFAVTIILTGQRLLFKYYVDSVIMGIDLRNIHLECVRL